MRNTYDALEVLTDSVTRVGTLLSKTALQGYAFEADFIHEDTLAAIQAEVDALNLEGGDHISHPINRGSGNEVRQNHARAYRSIDAPDVPVATRICKELARAVCAQSDTYPSLTSWMPNEIGYQLYRDDNDYISAHRDRSSDQLLSATISVTGSTTVEIYKTVDDPMDYSITNIEKIDEFTTTPGSVMFLRAPGFDTTDMLQTLHAVPPPSTPSRLVLKLRQRPTILKTPRHTKWQ